MRMKRIANVGGILTLMWLLVNSCTASSTNHNQKHARPSSGLSPATPSPGTTVFHAATAAILQSAPFLRPPQKVLLQLVPQHALSFRGGGGNKNNNSPTTGTGSNKLAQQTSQEAATLRRIKREYKDAVQMGIGYNWALGEPIQRPKKNKTKKNKAKSSKDLSIGDIEEDEDTSSTTTTTTIDDIMYPLRLGPLVTNLRHWHFTFQGCGVYENGLYHGRIILPKDYPASPPRVQMWTPNGRFKSGHDICLSASSYHPESWTPRWTVVSLVQALRLHMLTTGQEIGGLTDTTYEETMEYARKSLTWSCSWKVRGKTMKVDHALMIQQGAIVRPKPQQPVTATTTVSQEEQPKEGGDEEHEPIIVKDDDDKSTTSSEETMTATTPVMVEVEEISRSPADLPPDEQDTNNEEDVALEEHILAPKRRKTKSRKIKSAATAESSLSLSNSTATTSSTAHPRRSTWSAVTTKRKSNHQQRQQRNIPIPTDGRSILLLSISKWLFAAPLRLAIVSLILLFLILNRP